jgi:hypothetical protein
MRKISEVLLGREMNAKSQNQDVINTQTLKFLNKNTVIKKIMFFRFVLLSIYFLNNSPRQDLKTFTL